MVSLSTAAEKSLGAEGNLQTVKDPASTEAELRAGTAENETEPEMSAQTGMAGSGADVMLPSDEGNGATCTEAEKVTNNDKSLLASPVWPAYDSNCKRVSETESGQNLIRNGNGEPLSDEDGNQVYEQPGWHVIRDRTGMVLWDAEWQLCWEEVDEDLLALQTRSVHNQVPESLVEQNQRLQAELEQLQFVHQSDVERGEQMLAQQEAQTQTDYCAMVAELEKKQMEFADERCQEWEKYQKALHASQDDKTANDEKWTAWVQQLQADQAHKQKEVTDDFTRRIAELQQQ